MNSSPLRVSVIIPAHNAEAHLAAAVSSVLGQTWAALEVIIVNDGSTDATLSIARRCASLDPRVKVADKTNGGPSSARNAGIAIASGEAICFLDADDIYLPDKLQRQVAFLERFPGCDLVFSDYYIGDDEATPMHYESVRPAKLKMSEYLLYRNRFASMCPLLRSRFVADIGRFDETLWAGEDWEYWIRAAQRGRLCYLPGPVGVYRMHAAQSHHDRDLMRSNDRKVSELNFSAGSRERRILLASRAWAEGREAWWDHKLLLAPAKFIQSAWIARSPSLFRNVVRWA